MNKNISQNIFFLLVRRCRCVVILFLATIFHIARDCFEWTIFAGWRIEYMHESPFRFLCFLFVQKVILSSDRYYCYWCWWQCPPPPQQLHHHTNACKTWSQKKSIEENFRLFFSFVLEFLVSCLIAHSANRCVTKLFRIFFSFFLLLFPSLVRRFWYAIQSLVALLALYFIIIFFFPFDISIWTKIFLSAIFSLALGR